MEITETKLPGALLVTPRVFDDRRGWFFESYNQRDFAAAGIDLAFVQDNQSKSCRGTLRGLHFQMPPYAQAKLVRVLQGKIYDVIVDLRHDSPTYRQWDGVVLSAENHLMLFIPKGFAHGFCVLSETAEVFYKCDDFYAPAASRGIIWNDPDLGIAWPVTDPVLSDKDREYPPLRELPRYF